MTMKGALSLILLFWAGFGIPIASASADPDELCVRVFYDHSAEVGYDQGRKFALALQNLLGHFPEFRQIVEPIENYRKGKLSECRASFYFGVHGSMTVPEAFLDDYVAAEKNVVWIGSTIWKLGEERLKRVFGMKYAGQSMLDERRTDERGRPTFFRFFTYKGEVFEKYGEYPRGGGAFEGDFRMAMLQRVDGRAQVVSEAIHNGTGERIPYILRSGHRFHVADRVFSYNHESDRYLIVSDLLFDVLDAQPRRSESEPKPAVIRIEDLHSQISRAETLRLVDVLHRNGIPFYVALIPIYSDATSDGTPLRDSPEFVETLKLISERGGEFIWHGVTHQYGRNKNPSGISGNDFEFWDIRSQGPIAEDSASYVLDLLERGWEALSDAGISPEIWEVPHYRASALDYRLFSRLFSWSMGRIYTFVHQATGLPAEEQPGLWFEASGREGRSARRDALTGLKVAAEGKPFGQFFPYEIYGDVYGQRVLPENLGYPEKRPATPTRARLRTIDDIIADAKRNRVLRDVWGSFFFHPFMIEQPGMEEKLQLLFQRFNEFGYEFISLKDFIATRKTILRPEPLEYPLKPMASTTASREERAGHRF